MSERKLFRVQKMAAKVAHLRAQAWVLNRVVAAAAVGFIANNRMFQPREMDADLVRPARFELHINQREAIETFSHLKQRERTAPAAHDCHARAVCRIACERLVYLPRLILYPAVHQRNIRLEDRSIAKLIGKVFQRRFRFGDDQES